MGGPHVGEVPGKTNSTEGVPSFLIFPTEEAGKSWIVLFLRGNGYMGLSISAVFMKYCPKNGGDPVQYAQRVVDAFKGQIALDTTLSQLTDDQLRQVAEVIGSVEGSIPAID